MFALVLLLLAANSLNFMDRAAIGVLGGAIRADLSLTGAQFGLVTGAAFAAAYAFAALPVARLADRTDRALTLTACLTVWSLAMLLGAKADGFAMLAASRLLVALGESAAAAISYSIVIANAPARDRTAMIAVVAAGAPLGSFACGLIFPKIAEAHEWRTAFLWAGFAGLLFAPLLWVGLRKLAPEQPRPSAAGRGLWASAVRVWIDPAQRRLAVLYFAVAMVMTSVVAWMPQILQHWRGMSLGEAGAAFGAAMLIGGLTGTVVIPPALARWTAGDHDAALHRAIFLALAGFAAFALSASPALGPTFMLSVGIALVTALLPLIYAAIPSVAGAQGHTETNAAIFLPGNLIATSAGPLIVGLAADALPQADKAGPVAGLLLVLATATVIIMAGGVFRRPVREVLP